VSLFPFYSSALARGERRNDGAAKLVLHDLRRKEEKRKERRNRTSSRHSHLDERREAQIPFSSRGKDEEEEKKCAAPALGSFLPQLFIVRRPQ